MSALMEAVSSVVGSVVGSDPVARAAGRLESFTRKSADAVARVARLEADLEATRQRLRQADGDEDPEKIGSKLAKLRAELEAARDVAAGFGEARQDAEAGLAEVRARAEREALEAELGPLDAATAAAARDFEKHLEPQVDALSRGFANDSAAAAIRERLGLPRALPFAAGLDAALASLTERLRAKHGDAHGRGIGSHSIEVPIFNAETDAPRAKALGLI